MTLLGRRRRTTTLDRVRARVFALARPDVFRWIADVAAVLAVGVGRHEFDDVDAAEQRAIATLVRALAVAGAVAIEAAELFARREIQVLCTCGHPYGMHAVRSPHGCVSPEPCACRTFVAIVPLAQEKPT